MKKRKILLIILGIVIVALCTVATYAYFSATITGNSNNKNVKVDMSKMKLEFSDKTGLVKADNINPGWTYQKKVSVTNTGTVPVTYDLVWLSLQNEIEKDEMEYSITCTNCNGIENTPVPFGGENLKIVTNTIGSGEIQEYTINFTFKEINAPQNYNENKTFNGNIGILQTDTYEEKYVGVLSDTDWEYTIDEESKKVTLTKYVSSNPNVEIYPIYVKDNKQYKTVIKDSKYTGNPKFQFIFSNIDFGKYYSIIEKVKFMGNIEFENNSMSALFYGCTNLKEVDLSKIDTSNITNMEYMFGNCNSLTKIINLKVSANTNIGYMYSGCSSLTSIDITGYDLKNRTNMSDLFYGLSAIKSTDDIKGYDKLNNKEATSNVTNMMSMFSGCSSLTSIDLSSFNTSNVTDMRFMFQGCSSLTDLDLSNFDTSNVAYMPSMFYGCNALTNLDLSNFDTSNVTVMTSMFSNVPTNVEIITNDNVKNWLNENFPELTNVHGNA